MENATCSSKYIKTVEDFYNRQFIYCVEIEGGYSLDRYDHQSSGLYNPPENIFALRKMGKNTLRYPFSKAPAGVREEAVRVADLWCPNN